MPLLNFQARFADDVESGRKRQTIRKRRKDGRDPRIGDRLYLYTGCRTKHARKLGEAECTASMGIEFDKYGRLKVDYPDIGCVHVNEAKARLIADRDGFASYAEMVEWFRETHGLPFYGLLIQWGGIEK